MRFLMTAMLIGLAPAAAAQSKAPPVATSAAAKKMHVPIEVDVPGLSAAEKKAHKIWNLRAALNVAALQCQFSPFLRTVPSYNALLKQHAGEFERARQTVNGFFMKKGKAGAKEFDRYNTRVYQSYATFDAQLPFCSAASNAGRDVLAQPIGKLGLIAEERLSAIRASLGALPIAPEPAQFVYLAAAPAP